MILSLQKPIMEWSTGIMRVQLWVTHHAQNSILFSYAYCKCRVLVQAIFHQIDFCISFCQSSRTIHTDGEGGGFMTDSTIADSTSVVSVQSSVSSRSSRSGLTRQGNHNCKLLFVSNHGHYTPYYMVTLTRTKLEIKHWGRDTALSRVDTCRVSP